MFNTDHFLRIKCFRLSEVVPPLIRHKSFPSLVIYKIAIVVRMSKCPETHLSILPTWFLRDICCKSGRDRAVGMYGVNSRCRKGWTMMAEYHYLATGFRPHNMRNLIVKPCSVSLMDGAMGFNSPILAVIKIIKAKANMSFLALGDPRI